MIKRINPPTVLAPRGPYSHAIEVPANARLVFVAGQSGRTPDGNGKMISDKVEEQYEQALRNIKAILEATGMTPEDIVRMTTYALEQSTVEVVRHVRPRVFGPKANATGAFVVVKALAFPEMLVEVDAIAAKVD